MIVLTTPNENNFEGWRRHKTAVPLIINCPDRIDVKAMCFWRKHMQPTGEQVREQAKYWETVEERMDEVGPIPRCVFNEIEYKIQLSAIEKAVKLIEPSNATDYMGVGRSKIWIAEDVSHTIVRFVRVREEPGIEVGCNAPVSRSAMATITQHLTHMTPPVDVFNLLLRNFSCFLWVVFEYAGTATFMNPHAVVIIQRKLTELQP
ncbi:putative retrotransposon hot spot (RHS) protein [Trypanosoma cruzi]|uniref:Putative retrotransposon hot spot (RHS) protein n=1 Tax=Trypanosoma cruzi TaxID=5693 RepID=A0A2V2WU59_TRYCR|nr:putative retrotransposon hot spot (RHS) protein [Trypanosoma cruzi]